MRLMGSYYAVYAMTMKGGKSVPNIFFSLEKYRSKQKTISRIKLLDGSFSSDAKVILNECREFYKKLYSKNVSIDLNSHREFFTNVTIPKLSEQEKQFCESDITLNELFENLKNLKKIKALDLTG